MKAPGKELDMNRQDYLHHAPIRRSDGTWTVSDVANLLPMAVIAARYWRDSGRARHA